MSRNPSFNPIPNVRVIGVTGRARHGKDTFANLLLDIVPGAERFAFSDLLAARLRLEGRMQQRNPRVLQNEHFRTDRACLLLAMYHAIEDKAPPLAIVTGVRKADELDMVHQMGGLVVRIVRTNPSGGIFETDDRDPNHPIEQDIDALNDDVMFAAPSGDVETLRRCALALATERAYRIRA